MFQIRVFSFTLFLLFLSVTARSAREPLCSKFSYDEQLLEKMVRVEFNVNTMEKNMLDTEKRIKETEQKVMETRSQLTETQDTMLNTLKEINEKLNLLEQKEDSKTDETTIAFQAHRLADKSIANNQVIVFTKVKLNEGSAYSNTDGYFTAPVSGIYFFSCHLCGVPDKYINYAIVSNSVTRASGLFMPFKHGTCTLFSGVVSMRFGERAWVTVEANGSPSSDILYEDDRDWNYFSGFLIRALR